MENMVESAGQVTAGSNDRETAAPQTTESQSTMPQTTAPGSQRPGGRTAKVRTAVLRAAQDELVERGFSNVNMDEVAKRAGVGKTTVYRRWVNRDGLIADVLVDLSEQSTIQADMGTLEANLTAQAESVLNALTDERLGAIFRALVAAATCNQTIAAALHTFHAGRIDEWAINIQAAIDKGDLPTGTDAREVVRSIAAPLQYRVMVTKEPIDCDTARRSVKATLAAARAGAFVLDIS